VSWQRSLSLLFTRPCAELAGFSLAGIHTQHGIERTKTDQRGNKKYTCYCQCKISQGTGDCFGKKQCCQYKCDEDSDDFVGSAHVLFHS
jgi:hypothetical protein